MITIGELLLHAKRCTELAEVCTDPTVANKLRQLAQDYREWAGHTLAPHDPVGRIEIELAN
jgi:hypothetical protein